MKILSQKEIDKETELSLKLIESVNEKKKNNPKKGFKGIPTLGKKRL
jgi:hypothetical protein